MLSDALAAAVSELDVYLKDPEWRRKYSDDVISEAKLLRDRMDALRARLDQARSATS